MIPDRRLKRPMIKLLGELRVVRAGGATPFTRYVEQIVDGCKLRVVCVVEPLKPPRRAKQPARAAPGFKKKPQPYGKGPGFFKTPNPGGFTP